MSAPLSKRQQARNERALQDLIKSVPGNNVCADCQTRNPGWASWSLGVFLCLRCAALHRKMGTHITKVKSLSMDSWSNEQVENMKRVGNITSNQTYNPQNTKPPIPIDADEADSAMERFIRAKYQHRAATKNNTGSSYSDDHPPPLPPKTGGKFGFRSASSIFPLSAKSRRDPPGPVQIRRHQSPNPEIRREMDIFGGENGPTSGPQDLAGKMKELRDMGFADDKRNLAVLNGLGGNLEKTIDTLVRLGEGSGNVASDASSSRSRTPMSPTFPSGAGLAVNRARDKLSPRSTTSTNPFDMLDKPSAPTAQPQSSQSTGSIPQPQNQPAANNPFNIAGSNPFGVQPSQSQYSLNQTFQNLTVSSSQPLFPNHTGGFPGPQQQQQQLYQQSMTPPVPSLPQQYYPSIIYENPAQQLPQATAESSQQPTSYNPFLPQQGIQPPNINTNFQNNPYIQQSQTPQSLYQSPVVHTPQQGLPFSNGIQQQPQHHTNPFFDQSIAPQHIPQQQMSQQIMQQPLDYQASNQIRQQTYPQLPQQTGKADTRSILDLYNYPQLAPSRPQQPEQQIAPQGPVEQPQTSSFSPTTPAPTLQQRSISSPLVTQIAGSRNPFVTSGGDPAQSAGDSLGNMAQFSPPARHGTRHVSQESMSLNTGGWQNGRHSPDAFGTLSARSAR